MPHKVFIGYSLEDKLVADAACAALEAQRIPCWIAPRDILTNDESGEAISEMLAQCHIVLLIFSAKAIDSPEVRREIDWAVSKGKIIVPMRIDDIPASDTFKFARGKTHWLDALTPALETNLTQLCDTITRLLPEQKKIDVPLWTLHDSVSEAVTPVVIEPESIRQNATVTDAVKEPLTTTALKSETEQTLKPLVAQAEVKPSIVQPIPLPVYSWPAPPQSPSAVSKTVQYEEVNEPAHYSAQEQAELPNVAHVAVQQSFSSSSPIFPTTSRSQIHAVEDKSLFGQEENEPVARKAYWTSSRMTFVVLFCIATLIMGFLFLRQSKQSSVKAHTVPSSTSELPVTPYLRPSQPVLTPVNVKQSSQSIASSETPKQLHSQNEVVPATSQSALKVQPSGSVKIESLTNAALANPAATPSPPAQSATENHLIWVDSATGLTWAKKDSGDNNDLTWNAAIDYCKNLQLDSHNNWRLPTIDELQGLYDAGLLIEGQCCGGQSKTWHVKGNIKLSGWQWSSTQGDNAQKAVYLSLSDDKEFTSPISNSDSLRALCVRSAGK